ncbi:Uncharacterised protein [Citrobacter werkmanii]|uniref:Uncharacterized protein n=1 Tax=Citrobacter werkmanii TaxID=67827 RepID=A0ABM8N5I2_9ENTR|nr:Uncharacterised protein [Citrobacter werkmanii]
MLFGRPADTNQPASDDNPPQAFHLYTMRRAIEEKFILDVLNGYVPYKTAFNLSKQLEDSKRVSGKAAKRAPGTVDVIAPYQCDPEGAVYR